MRLRGGGSGWRRWRCRRVGGELLLLWVVGERLEACRLRGHVCGEVWAVSGQGGAAAKPLWVSSNGNSYLVLWVSSRGSWAGRRLDAGGRPLGAGLSVLGEGSVTGIALGDDAFWISQAIGEPRPGSEDPPKEPGVGTVLVRWPLDAAAVPEVAIKHPAFTRFFLTTHGAVSLDKDPSTKLRTFRWHPWALFAAGLAGSAAQGVDPAVGRPKIVPPP